jgi:hypothetical protein
MNSVKFSRITIVFIWRIDEQRGLRIEILTTKHSTVSLKGFGIEDLKEGIAASEPFCITYPKHIC